MYRPRLEIEDLRAIFGGRGYAAYCQCQKLKFKNWAERHATPR